jgi:hypothetical protein
MILLVNTGMIQKIYNLLTSSCGNGSGGWHKTASSFHCQNVHSACNNAHDPAGNVVNPFKAHNLFDYRLANIKLVCG